MPFSGLNTDSIKLKLEALKRVFIAFLFNFGQFFGPESENYVLSRRCVNYENRAQQFNVSLSYSWNCQGFS